MASTQVFQKLFLTAEDVPGAKIDTDGLKNYGNVQLKRWLQCRGLKTAGNRPDLLQRCRDAVSAGKCDDIAVDVDQGKWYQIKAKNLKKQASQSTNESISPLIPPILGWKHFPSRKVPSNYNYGHIYHYLLESVVLSDGNKSEDTDLSHMTSKPLTRGEQYVKSGSVTEIMDAERNGHYYLKAKVPAYMRNEDRNVHITPSCTSGAVRDASYSPGSALGRCNHVAAVLLAVDKHCKEFGYDPLSCTSKPCE